MIPLSNRDRYIDICLYASRYSVIDRISQNSTHRTYGVLPFGRTDWLDLAAAIENRAHRKTLLAHIDTLRLLSGQSHAIGPLQLPPPGCSSEQRPDLAGTRRHVLHSPRLNPSRTIDLNFTHSLLALSPERTRLIVRPRQLASLLLLYNPRARDTLAHTLHSTTRLSALLDRYTFSTLTLHSLYIALALFSEPLPCSLSSLS